MVVDVILVPQGAEHQAVRSGLSRIRGKLPIVVPIPVGMPAVKAYLQGWLQGAIFSEQGQMRVVVMGLAGSLSPRYQIGDVVIYRDCLPFTALSDLSQPSYPCDRALTEFLQRQLDRDMSIVNALTSDRVIHTAQEKQTLAQTSDAEVVDMEGAAILELLGEAGIAVAMLRVISDDCYHDLPDLSHAIRADGTLHPTRMALAMLRQPIAAFRLIRGSLKGLRVLREVTQVLFAP
ncbi:MAG: hypothetical protein Kow00121_20010 [Elainellaceae cyanobacterium]